MSLHCTVLCYTVSVLGREEGYTVKYTPLPEGVPEGKALGKSYKDNNSLIILIDN